MSSYNSNVSSGSLRSRKKLFSKPAMTWTLTFDKSTSSPLLTRSFNAIISEWFPERRNIPSVSIMPVMDRESTHFRTIGGMELRHGLLDTMNLRGAPNCTVLAICFAMLLFPPPYPYTKLDEVPLLRNNCSSKSHTLSGTFIFDRPNAWRNSSKLEIYTSFCRNLPLINGLKNFQIKHRKKTVSY